MNSEPSKPPAFEQISCPVCTPVSLGSKGVSAGPARYQHCSGCGTVFASPRSSAKVRLAWIDENFGVGAAAFKNAESRITVLQMEAERIQGLVNGGRILDVGCDLGDFLKLFPVNRWERFGVEISPSAAAYARVHSEAEVFAGVLAEAAYPDAHFDLLTYMDVVYYLDNPATEFLEARRVVRPNGKLVIELSGKAYQLTRSRGVISWLFDRKWSRVSPDGAYLFWFTPKAMQKLLFQSGFIVIGFDVMPGAPQRHSLTKTLSHIYYTAVRRFSNWGTSALTWAPKYLFYAAARGISEVPMVRQAGTEDVAQVVNLHCNNIRSDNPGRLERKILTHYYSEILLRKGCGLHVLECRGEIIGFSSMIRNHRQLLMGLLLRHPSAIFVYVINSISGLARGRRSLDRIFEELFLTKWPKGTNLPKNFSELRAIAVDPKFRGNGLARPLLDASMAHLQKMRGVRCIAWVASSNFASLALFKNAGFSTLATRKDRRGEVQVLQWEHQLEHA